MGTTETVGFQLTTTDGPTLVDESGNVWRYIHYPRGSHAADLAGNYDHDGVCYWYLDIPKKGRRDLIEAGDGMPCIHQDTEVRSGVVKTETVWYLRESVRNASQTFPAHSITEVPSRWILHHTYAFKVTELISVREHLGWGRVEIKDLTAEVETVLAIGERIATYWQERNELRWDEARLARPASSSVYRDRVERIRNIQERLEEDGYSVALLDQGYDLDAAGEFGAKYLQGRFPGSRRQNSARLYAIGEWAETARVNAAAPTAKVAANEAAVSELLDW